VSPQTVAIVVILAALWLIRLVVVNTRDISPESREMIAGLLREVTVVVALVYFLVRPLVIQTCWIPSGSMVPTLQEGDRVLVNSFIYRYRPPERGDVVVFHPPKAALQTREELERPVDFVKRLIGLPGERVRTDPDGQVYINGKPMSQAKAPAGSGSYRFPECLVYSEACGPVLGDETWPVPCRRIQCRSPRGEPFELWVTRSPEDPTRLEAVVPPGCYLVLGDNRDQSDDSHRWGTLPAESVVGEAIAIFWPPERASLIGLR